MVSKTATVTARIQPEVKESAERILSQLGIPVSVFIDMAYRQVIAKNGIPFSLDLRSSIIARDEMSESQFNSMIARGIKEADENQAQDANVVISNLRKLV